MMTKEELLQKKAELEDEISTLDNMQMALKILINSEYGALGNVYFRYYDIDLATAVTLSGQLAIRWCEDYLMNHPLQKKYNWKVIYIDTDSLYIHMEDVVNRIKEANPDITDQRLVDKLDQFNEKVIQKIIDEGYQKLAEYVNAPENFMNMKREKIISGFMIPTKKKYAMKVWDNEGVRYNEPKLSVTGLQSISSSTPKPVREYLNQSYGHILDDHTKLSFYIREVKNDFKHIPIEDIATIKSCNNIKKYTDPETKLWIKRTPIHVRASIVYNKYVTENNLEWKYPIIQEGEKIKYVYLRMPNPLHTNVVGFIRELPEEFRDYVDYRKMYIKTYYTAMENFKNVCNTPINLKCEVDLNSLF